jgi:hypothetical protein
VNSTVRRTARGETVWNLMKNPVPARHRGQGMGRVLWLPSFLSRAKQAKGTAPSMTPEPEMVIRNVQERLPCMKWAQRSAKTLWEVIHW